MRLVPIEIQLTEDERELVWGLKLYIDISDFGVFSVRVQVY